MARNSGSRLTAVALLLTAVATLGFAGAAEAEEWRWTGAAYVWMSSVGVDMEVNDRQVIDSTMDFGDVVSKLDMAVALHAEGQRGAHGFLFDLNYVDLGDDPTVVDLPGTLPGTVSVRGDMSMNTIEVGGLYNPSGDGSGFTYIYGVRILDVDVKVDADFSFPLFADRSYETGGTLYDAMLGARWAAELSDRWNFSLRGDAAGGGSEFTWNAVAAIGYELGSTGRYTALAGYRHMSMELKEKDDRAEVETEQILSGAFVALAIRL